MMYARMLDAARLLEQGAFTVRYLQIDSAAYRPLVQQIRQRNYRLLALVARFQEGFSWIESCWSGGNHLLILDLRLASGELIYPDIADLYPVAQRMQRSIFDLHGLQVFHQTGQAVDTRPWLNHGWSPECFPLRPDFDVDVEWQDRAYQFVRVQGAGIHEVAVGPVHAGTIEPGHFRFSVVGEKVLRLEQRLGYCHRGVDYLLSQTPLLEAAPLAARCCGDSTVAYSWAWAMAVEQALGVTPPSRAAGIRALLLERERVAQHLLDLGALAQDAGWSLPMSWLSRLREDWLRSQQHWCGHRLMMDMIVPGGCVRDIDAETGQRWLDESIQLMQNVETIFSRFEEHGGLQDRLMGAGYLSPALAQRLGVCGLVGRASGQEMDVRHDVRYEPYRSVRPGKQVLTQGDVAARVQIRFAELFASLFLIGQLYEHLLEGPVLQPLPEIPALPTQGYGWVEGWRGEILCVLHQDQGKILRAHLHDPSWQNWPALEYAILDNIIADFPLINKSFNLAYAGHDL